MSDNKSDLVYSTDKVVPRKEGQAQKSSRSTGPAQESVRVRLERKGRGGKTVTVIEGIRMSAEDRMWLLRRLKAMLGTGGAVKNDVLEIQGDHREMIITLLQDMGHKAKRSGG
jgi:translation initiation factor 1